MADETILIRMAGVSYKYPGSQLNAVDDLSMTFGKKDRIGLIAPNGSGKTTLFHLIMGLIKPDQGDIEIFGKKVVKEKDFIPVRQKIGLLFQDSDDQLFSPTVIEDVAFGPLNLGKSKEEAIDISKRTLQFLGLEDFADRITFKLSGGEKRLVALATILSMEPSVLLLDEPTTGLDSRTKAKLIDILNHLSLPGIVISHEYDFITAVTDHIYTMENGKINLDEELHIHKHHHVHQHGKQPHKHV
ncbi:MAG: energy-coupling factor ABC transporter ATP-binding protein [Proteobacteria bacterium]|nr:energy-coupling factor ABC transporter ATP-binding protein [Pseudomonadota bacterium]